MLLYLIRHGESEANADGTHSGWSPVNLTEAGRAQAASARSLLDGVVFDRIYVSDIKRAQQTAELALPGRAYCYCSLIRELNNTAMRGKTAQQMLSLYPDLYPVCRKRFDYAPLGLDCESGAHLLNRAASFLSMLQDEGDSKIAAVCHAGFIRACAAWALNTPTHIPPLDVDNASVSILEYRRARWHVRQWNLTSEQ
ncbi:MAG: histidine phosphatase family protein [Clostridia bacterium]|nr:histidine phosphatase family protein [Clostridia bacterium]